MSIGFCRRSSSVSNTRTAPGAAQQKQLNGGHETDDEMDAAQHDAPHPINLSHDQLFDDLRRIDAGELLVEPLGLEGEAVELKA